MITKTLALGFLLISCPALAQNESHWYWDVDVNGTQIDALDPVGVTSGDVVTIGLRVTWSPHYRDFGSSLFSLNRKAGDSSPLFHSGMLDFSTANGFGRSRPDEQISPDNGTPFDTDGDGLFDSLDLIDFFHIPPFFVLDNEIPQHSILYSMQWTVGDTPFVPFSVQRGPTAAGVLTTNIYTDAFGNSVPFDSINDELAFVYVPAPATTLALIPLITRRRRQGNSA